MTNDYKHNSLLLDLKAKPDIFSAYLTGNNTQTNKKHEYGIIRYTTHTKLM